MWALTCRHMATCTSRNKQGGGGSKAPRHADCCTPLGALLLQTLLWRFTALRWWTASSVVFQSLLRTQGKAAERGGTAVVLEAEGHEDEDEDMPVPPPEEPDSDAPHFTAWPEQRGFGQVVADKAGDTIQVRRGCRAGVAWAGGRDLCTSCQSVRFCTNWYATSVWRGRATHASSQGVA